MCIATGDRVPLDAPYIWNPFLVTLRAACTVSCSQHGPLLLFLSLRANNMFPVFFVEYIFVIVSPFLILNNNKRIIDFFYFRNLGIRWVEHASFVLWQPCVQFLSWRLANLIIFVVFFSVSMILK
jgi:hypothetical protein